MTRVAELLLGVALAGCAGAHPASSAVRGTAAASHVDRSAPSDRVSLGLPLGLMWPTFPSGHPPTQAEVMLGARLFADPGLSADGQVSCATCHEPSAGFADARVASAGVYGRTGVRNSQTLLNAGYATEFGWDGAHDSLESQALAALTNPREMGASAASLEQRVNDAYGAQLAELYGNSSLAGALAALGAYQRTLIAGDSPMDDFIYRGDEGAVSAEARRGFEIFLGKGRCVRCHFMRSRQSHPFGGESGLFTDGKYHNIGIGFERGSTPADVGRASITGQVEERFAFKTPTLRNVALTAPYMHDGSLASLEAVVDYYDRGGNANPGLDADIKRLDLTSSERAALIAFLTALTSRGLPHAERSP
jgi:cytochrome c peroxidase